MSRLRLVLDSSVRNEVNQSWSITQIVKEACPISWQKVFDNAKDELDEISEILDNQEREYGPYYPLKKNLFNAFHLTALHDIKIVLIGQDPYHQCLDNGLPRAQGLSFSVARDDEIPSSLMNIYKELTDSIPGFIQPYHGDLTGWARQGVFLINSCLTVRSNEAGSHKQVWMPFIIQVLNAISEVRPYAVYILLGKKSQELKQHIQTKSPILETSHPSGFSARQGFLGSKIFANANTILIEKGLSPIDWNALE